jgi:hypothetical protein
MGNNFSNRQDLYIHSIDNAQCQELQDQIMIRINFTDKNEPHIIFTNPFRRLVSEKDTSQRICILALNLSYICNETKHDLLIHLHHLFEVLNKKNEDAAHVDDTGHVKILCPGNFNGPVLGNDRILYKPRLNLDVIRNYACLNLLDINVKSIGENSQESILELSHPLIYFILNNEEKLQEFGTNMIQRISNDSGSFVKVDTVYLNRVKEFFKNTIFDDLRPTRFDDVKIECPIPKDLANELANKKSSFFSPSITVLIQINYLLISESAGKLKQIKI